MTKEKLHELPDEEPPVSVSAVVLHEAAKKATVEAPRKRSFWPWKKVK